MKPPAFDYIPATSLDEALTALADGGEDAKVLAGGQSLIPMLSLRLAYPSLLIDLNRLDELTGIERTTGTLRIGSMVRHRTAERSEEVADAVPLVAAVMPFIGHTAIRSRGTIGGSISHADPAAELPAVAIALDATINARSAARGDRAIPAADFFQGYFTSALEPDEIVTSIEFPVATQGTVVGVEEVARRHGDFAMVGAVASLDTASNEARIALINVADTPVRATEAEAAYKSGASLDDVAAAATRDLEPSDDLHASSAYRKKVTGVCVKRALAEAREAGSR